MRVAFWRQKRINISTTKMERRSGRKYNTRSSSGGGVTSNAHCISSVQKTDICSPKRNSRMLKQLQMDLCMKQIVPRVQLDSPTNNKIDAQYNLRRRVSQPIATTAPHVNKRKSNGQVRLFGICDSNPNLWLKSTRPFFLEERFDSPIHKLIEINKQAMLAFQEPTSEPAATIATPKASSKQIDKCLQNNNIESFNNDQSQSDAIVGAANIVLVETYTVPSGIIDLPEPNGDIDFEDQIVSYKVCQDVNMNENITITSVAAASPIAEKIADDSEYAIGEPMYWIGSSDSQNHDDDIQVVDETNDQDETQMDFQVHVNIQEDDVDIEMPSESIVHDQSLESIVYDQPLESIVHDQPRESIVHDQPLESIVHDQPRESIVHDQPLESIVYDQPLESIVHDQPLESIVHDQLFESIVHDQPLESIVYDQPLESIHANESPECIGLEEPVESFGLVEATGIIIESETENLPTETDIEMSAPPAETNEENLEMPREGVLVWAQLAKYPFWPAIVHPDEDQDQLTFNDNGVHVMFLADNRRTAWIKSRKSLLPFKGQQQYEEHRVRVLSNKETQKRKSDVRPKIMYKIPSNEAWKLAVAEGDVLALVSIEHRLTFYKKVLTDVSTKLKTVDDTISISSVSTMSEMGKSSSPCTFDTAYSSMKPSSSSSASLSIVSDSTSSSSVCMFAEGGDEQSHQRPEPNQEIYCRDEHIKYFLQSVPDNPHPKPEQVTINPKLESLAPNSDAQPEPMTVSVKLELPDYNDSISVAAMSAKNILDLIMDVFKQNIVIEGKMDEFLEAHSQLRLKLTSKIKTTSKRKHQQIEVSSVGNKIAKRPKVMPEKGTARTKANASRNLLPYVYRNLASPKPAVTDPEAVEQLKLKKAEDKWKRLLELQEHMYEYAMQKNPTNYLFKKLPKDLVCQVCLKPGNVFACKCGGIYHRECSSKSRHSDTSDWYDAYMERTSSDATTIDLVTGEDFMEPSTLCIKISSFDCSTCLGGRKPQCFVCSTDAGELTECSKKGCDCHYHVSCLKYWPQHKLSHFNDTVKSLMCPRHVCQICIADHPNRNYASNVESDKNLIRCLLCPSTYHRRSNCIPAGSELLSHSQMVCPRHCKTPLKPVNTDWCFLCCKGGSLICCETCPAAFHQECLKISVADDKYICEECESGRLPLYGETVWAKYAGCKWWPAVLVDPFNVPSSVAAVKKGPNYMCVQFFGTYNLGWVCHGYVYLYQADDKNVGKVKQNDKGYSVAVEEASKYTKTIKEKYGERKVLRNRPQYIKIKLNNPVPPVKFKVDEEFEENECSCKPTDSDPCGPENNCINFALAIECNANCPAKENCTNQRFAKRIYPKVQLKYFESKGWGLVALEHIACNTFIIEYVGDVIDSDEFTKRFNRSLKEKVENFYFLRLENGLYIDSGIRGNEARFINHSCEPNCIPQKWTVDEQTRIGLFAAVDIPINTELTFNYNWNILNMQKCVCYCGTATCSGYIGYKCKGAKKL